jgi:hypothetical protein
LRVHHLRLLRSQCLRKLLLDHGWKRDLERIGRALQVLVVHMWVVVMMWLRDLWL